MKSGSYSELKQDSSSRLLVWHRIFGSFQLKHHWIALARQIYLLCEFAFQVGDSPLSKAAFLGYTTTVELLFGHGADVDGTDQEKSSSHSLEVQSWTIDN